MKIDHCTLSRSFSCIFTSLSSILPFLKQYKQPSIHRTCVTVWLMYSFSYKHMAHTRIKSAYYHHTVHNRCCNCFVQSFHRASWLLVWDDYYYDNTTRLLVRRRYAAADDDEGVNFWDTKFVFQYSMCNHFKRYIYRVRIPKKTRNGSLIIYKIIISNNNI